MGFDPSGIDSVLTDALAAGVCHGVVATVVDREGVLYEAAWGEASTDTIFRNASMTKALTTTAALQLLEQGRLELDAPVDSFLPELSDIQVLDGFDGDRPLLRSPASRPTVRQLMTHTSGFGYFFLNPRLVRYYEHERLPGMFDGRRESLGIPLVNDPGTAWEYGVSTDWLGLVVERICGQTLGAYLAEHVYAPLRMDDSTFAPSPSQRERLLPIRARTPEGGLVESSIDLPDHPDWDSGGHGSYGSARDYARFVRAMLRGGELDGARILARDTVQLAFTDQLQGIPLPELQRSCMPELSNDVPSLPLPQGFGLGFHLFKVDLPGMRSAGTASWSGIFNTYYWIDRAAGVGGVLMTQVLPFYDARVLEAALAFEMAAYAQVGAATPAA